MPQLSDSHLQAQELKNKQINKELKQQRKLNERVKTLMIIGAGESGKSTILKQFRILAHQDYDYFERIDYRKRIKKNLIDSILSILNFMKLVHFNWLTLEEDVCLYLPDNVFKTETSNLCTPNNNKIMRVRSMKNFDILNMNHVKSPDANYKNPVPVPKRVPLKMTGKRKLPSSLPKLPRKSKSSASKCLSVSEKQSISEEDRLFLHTMQDYVHSKCESIDYTG